MFQSRHGRDHAASLGVSRGWTDRGIQGGRLPQALLPLFPSGEARVYGEEYQRLNSKIKQHSGSLPFLENRVENAADCKFKTKMDNRSSFWHVDLTERANDMMAFITPQGQIFMWRVMPFGISNAPALFQEMMSQVLCLVKRTPAVQELLTRGAVLEAQIDDVLLGTNSVENHLVLLSEFFEVCQEQHLRIKLEKCEFRRSEMQYLGATIRPGLWKPTDARLRPMLDFDFSEVNRKAEGVKIIRQFVGSCNFYRRHLKNFTCSSDPLTDLIKNDTKWQWTEKEQAALEEMNGKLKTCLLLGVPRPVGEMLLVTDASDVGGRGTLFQCQRLNKDWCKEVDQKLRTLGVNRDGTLRHGYNQDEWRLVPLGHWNWKWNDGRKIYRTYEQEIMSGVLLLASQTRIVGSNTVMWLCDQEPAQAFLHKPPSKKKRIRRWWPF